MLQTYKPVLVPIKNETNVRCEHCDLTFSNLVNLKQHQVKKHQDKILEKTQKLKELNKMALPVHTSGGPQLICDPNKFVLISSLWVPMGRLSVKFERARPARRFTQSLQSFGLTVLEAEKWRSSNQVEIKILLCKSTLQIPKIALDLL